MLINLRTQIGFNRQTYYEGVEAAVSLFSLLLAFYYTVSRCQLALKQFSRDLQPIFGATFAAVIGA